MIDRQAESSRHVQKNTTGIRQYGFPFYEWAVVVIIASVLGGVLLDRLQYYQDYAEKTAMDVTVRNMRNGLRLQVADLMMQDKMIDVDKLLKQNPITWLEKPPPNYVGELTAPDDDAIRPGSWYFERSRHELIYLPTTHRFFYASMPLEKKIRYRISAVVPPQEKNGNAKPRIEGLSLDSLNSSPSPGH